MRNVRVKCFLSGVIEPDPTYNSSATTLSVGGLRQQFSLSENVQIGLFARDFMRGYPNTLFGDLPSMLGSVPDVKFQPHGYLFLASEAGYDILMANHKTQVESGANTVVMSAGQLKSKFPWLGTEGVVAGCYGGEDEGWFDPWALLQAFKMSAVARGVEFITGSVRTLSCLPGVKCQAGVKFAGGEQKEFESDRVVIAAGGDSGYVGFLAGLGLGQGVMGVGLPIEKRKRYVYVPHCPEGPGMDCPLVIDPSGASNHHTSNS